MLTPEQYETFSYEIKKIATNFYEKLSGVPNLNQQDTSLLTGTSGMLYFLLDLYQLSGSPETLSIIEKNIENLLYFNGLDKENNYSLYQGKMGVVWLLLKYTAVTQRQKHLETAARIALDSGKQYLEASTTGDSLGNGRSGVLFVLLMLYRETGRKDILQLINRYAKKIISSLKFSQTGFYWNKPDRHIKGLCGYFEGNSGIGLVFSQLSECLDNDAFNYISRNALSYEDHQMTIGSDRTRLDYRKEINSPGDLHLFREKYAGRKLDFFSAPAENVSLLHGYLGMLSVRVRLQHESLGRHFGEGNLVETADQLFTTFSESPTDQKIEFGICLLELYKHTGNIHFFDLAILIASGSSFQGTDMNSAYFLLQLISPQRSSPLLAPFTAFTIPKSFIENKYPILDLTYAEIRKMALGTIFPRTLFLLENICGERLELFLEKKREPDIDDHWAFVSFSESILPGLPIEHQRPLDQFLTLEKAKLSLLANVQSFALENIAMFVNQETLEVLNVMPKSEFCSLTLSTARDIVVVDLDYEPVCKTYAAYTMNNPIIKKSILVLKLVPFENKQVFNTITDLNASPPRNETCVIELPVTQEEKNLLTLFQPGEKVSKVLESLLRTSVSAAEKDRSAPLINTIRRFLFYRILKVGAPL